LVAAESEIESLLLIRASCESTALLVETGARPTAWSANAPLPLKAGNS
jgi:hypothetical protein